MSQKNRCSFCGEKINEKDMISGLFGNICANCIEKCNEEVGNIVNKKTNIDSLKDMKPHLIKAELDKYVIGQEEAKKLLSVAVYNHYKKNNIETDMNIQKTNIIIQGPTGTGKTYLMEVLSKILDVPLVIVDATTFTEAGYAGKDVDFIIQKLLDVSNMDIEKAEKGIVYIDEIDKITKKNTDSEKRDASGEGVQQALLKMLENGEITVEKRNDFLTDSIVVNTSNILFVAGGAFVGIDSIIKNRNPKAKKSIGFNCSNEEDLNNIDFENELTHDDLIKFGLIPEFVGRFPIIITLKDLNKDDLKDILTKPQNAIIKQYEALLKVDGVDLNFSEDAINYIVEEAEKKKIGARGLKSIIEKQMYQLMYDIPQKNLTELTITKEMLSPKKRKQLNS